MVQRKRQRATLNCEWQTVEYIGFGCYVRDLLIVRTRATQTRMLSGGPRKLGFTPPVSGEHGISNVALECTRSHLPITSF